MKATLLLLLALCASALGQGFTLRSPDFPRAALGAAPVFIRSATNTSSGSTCVISGFDCSGGNYCLVGTAFKNSITRNLTSITNASGQLFTNLVNVTTGTAKFVFQGFPNPTTGDITVTLNNTATQGFEVIAMLFSGVGPALTNGVGIYNSGGTSCSNVITSSTASVVADLIGWAVTSGAGITSGQIIRGIGTNATSGSVSMMCSTTNGAAGTQTVTGTNTTGTATTPFQLAVSLVGN